MNVVGGEGELVHYAERRDLNDHLRLFCSGAMIHEVNGFTPARWDPQARVTCLLCLMGIRNAAR